MKKSVLNGTAAAAVALLLSLFSGSYALAAGPTYTEGGMYYVIEDNGSITITDYFGNEDTVEIPALIGGHPVSSIAEGAFRNNAPDTVVLPETVTNVSSGAFGSGITVVYPEKSEVEPETPGMDPGVDPGTSEVDPGVDPGKPEANPGTEQTETKPAEGGSIEGAGKTETTAAPEAGSGTGGSGTGGGETVTPSGGGTVTGGARTSSGGTGTIPVYDVGGPDDPTSYGGSEDQGEFGSSGGSSAASSSGSSGGSGSGGNPDGSTDGSALGRNSSESGSDRNSDGNGTSVSGSIQPATDVVRPTTGIVKPSEGSAAGPDGEMTDDSAETATGIEKAVNASSEHSAETVEGQTSPAKEIVVAETTGAEGGTPATEAAVGGVPATEAAVGGTVGTGAAAGEVPASAAAGAAAVCAMICAAVYMIIFKRKK